jgi:hypothetical protein
VQAKASSYELDRTRPKSHGFRSFVSRFAGSNTPKTERKIPPPVEETTTEELSEVSTEAFGLPPEVLAKAVAFKTKALERRGDKQKEKGSNYPYLFCVRDKAIYVMKDVEAFADNCYLQLLIALAQPLGYSFVPRAQNSTGGDAHLEAATITDKDVVFVSAYLAELLGDSAIAGFPHKASYVDEDTFQARALVHAMVLTRFFVYEELPTHFFNIQIPNEYKGKGAWGKTTGTGKVFASRFSRISPTSSAGGIYSDLIFKLSAEYIQRSWEKTGNRVRLAKALRSPHDVYHSLCRTRKITIQRAGRRGKQEPEIQEVRLRNHFPHQLLGVRPVERPILKEAWEGTLGTINGIIKECDQTLSDRASAATIKDAVAILGNFESRVKAWIDGIEKARQQCLPTLNARVTELLQGKKLPIGERTEKIAAFWAANPWIGGQINAKFTQDQTDPVGAPWDLIPLLPNPIQTGRGLEDLGIVVGKYVEYYGHLPNTAHALRDIAMKSGLSKPKPLPKASRQTTSAQGDE